jgi:hypothetical protein
MARAWYRTAVPVTPRFKTRQLVKLRHDTVLLHSLLAGPAGSVGIVNRVYAGSLLVDVRFLDIRGVHGVPEFELEISD